MKDDDFTQKIIACAYKIYQKLKNLDRMNKIYRMGCGSRLRKRFLSRVIGLKPEYLQLHSQG